jgi:hypothetical protein
MRGMEVIEPCLKRIKYHVEVPDPLPGDSMPRPPKYLHCCQRRMVEMRRECQMVRRGNLRAERSVAGSKVTLKKVDDAAAARAKELKGKGISASDIGKMLGVSRATVYRYLA